MATIHMQPVQAGKPGGKRMSRKVRAAVVSVASVAAVVLLAVGVGFGVKAHNDRVVAAHARAVAVAQARTVCRDDYRKLVTARAQYESRLADKDVREALKIRRSDVKDGGTVEALARLSNDDSVLVPCKADNVRSLKASARKNAAVAQALTAKTAQLESASRSVTASRKVKQADDRAKADRARREAQKKAAQKAQQAQAQASQSAPAASVPSRSGATYNTGRSYGAYTGAGYSSGNGYNYRRNYTPTYQAPQRNYGTVSTQRKADPYKGIPTCDWSKTANSICVIRNLPKADKDGYMDMFKEPEVTVGGIGH